MREVRSLDGTNRWNGFLEGFGLGLAGGAVLGLGIGAAAGWWDGGGHPSVSPAGAGMVLGGLLGATGGMIFGAVKGHTYSYQFTGGVDQSAEFQSCLRGAHTGLAKINDLDPEVPESSFGNFFENASTGEGRPVPPQPFAPSTTCEFQLGRDDSVVIQILDMEGAPVCDQVSTYLERGSYRFTATPPEIEGVYIVRLTLGQVQWTKKVVLVN
jgi:hypothetical protein